jgi:DNA-binding XRE family transcriptional regulator
MNNQEFVKIRIDMGITQNRLSRILCVSLKTIQSFEQGWRNIPAHIEREMLLFQVLKYSGNSGTPPVPCWQIRDCAEAWRKECIVWALQVRHFCWYLNGTFCFGKAQENWEEKIRLCRQCDVFINDFLDRRDGKDDSPIQADE